jgi:ATP-dependent Lon protease
VLDEDHYGLDDVKRRILEFLAVRKLEPKHGGSILCFAGPPGVGKTSLGRSIAARDEAQVLALLARRHARRGRDQGPPAHLHRRDAGRILQGLKACASNNPVIVLDEVDKLGSDFRGDPSSALLEVLDPEQNTAFLDHYLDVPFDLSRVLFVATANALPAIPSRCADRMEVIELPGYLMSEKVQIALRHLIPKQLERHGIQRQQLSFREPALRAMIQRYTREAGVRGLEKCVVQCCRKTAFAIAKGQKVPGARARVRLDALLGPPRFVEDGERKVKASGVAQGLAWTPHGGDVLFIEAARMPGKGGLTLTGQLGDVMNESSRIALSYLRSHTQRVRARPRRLRQAATTTCTSRRRDPEGRPVGRHRDRVRADLDVHEARFPSDLAMTGELTLVGEVLPIGGVREKVIAAERYAHQARRSCRRRTSATCESSSRTRRPGSSSSSSIGSTRCTRSCSAEPGAKPPGPRSEGRARRERPASPRRTARPRRRAAAARSARAAAG